MLKVFVRRLRTSSTRTAVCSRRDRDTRSLDVANPCNRDIRESADNQIKGLTTDFERTERRVFVASEWRTIPVVCRAHILKNPQRDL